MNLTSEKEYLEQALATFNASGYLRSIYHPYTEEDIRKVEEQFKTGKSAYTKEDYVRAKSREEKQKILLGFTVAYHESFHYFQRLITSFGVFDQYIRTLRNSALLDILLQHNGLPGESLSEYVNNNSPIFEKDHILSREWRLLTSLMYGADLLLDDKPIPLFEGSIFKTLPLRVMKEFSLPQICIEVDDCLYPLGAQVLLESWAYSSLRHAVHQAWGDDAASHYAELHDIFPYKVLEHLLQKLCPDDVVSRKPHLMSYLVSVVAFYGLNHTAPIPGIITLNKDFLPGYRAATLMERMRDCFRQGRDAEEGLMWSALDCALSLDEDANWTSFIINGYRTYDRICRYLSKLTEHEQWHINTFNYGAHARFMNEAELAILDTLTDTAIIFQIQNWLFAYSIRKTLYRPPLFHCVKIIDNKEVHDLLCMSKEPEEVRFWATYYLIWSIIDQKIESMTWRCPLSEFGHTICKKYDGSICRDEISSFEVLSNVGIQECLLRQIIEQLNSIRQKDAIIEFDV